MKVFIQNWTEYERGWGSRPDGFTVHLSIADRDKYVKDFNKKFNNQKYAPDEYIAASDEPFSVDVTPILHKKLQTAIRGAVKGLRGNGSFFQKDKTLTSKYVQLPKSKKKRVT